MLSSIFHVQNSRVFEMRKYNILKAYNMIYVTSMYKVWKDVVISCGCSNLWSKKLNAQIIVWMLPLYPSHATNKLLCESDR